MNDDSIKKIHLCLHELQMIREVIDLSVADDFCSRMLGIYVMMRVDDITKIWSHSIPKNDPKRKIADKVKSKYNDRRPVRDKLGAHFQSDSDTGEKYASLMRFKSIDYANTMCMIDDVMEAEAEIEDREVTVEGFRELGDLGTVREVLMRFYSDDTANLTNGTLDLFAVNKGGLICSGEPMLKGQDLRSIELMVELSKGLLGNEYHDKAVERMFKRLYLCMVCNYHDNLIPRKKAGGDGSRHDGFDVLFPRLITSNDDKEMLSTAFDKFEQLYQVEPVMERYKTVRNHACAHFDEERTLEDINGELDAVDIEELDNAYREMLNLFNFICKSVLLLRPLTLPARSPLYDAQFETMKGIEDFNGNTPEEPEMPKELSCMDIMRVIRKRGELYGYACHTMKSKLMSHDVNVYQEMMTVIADRLREPTITDEEMSAIFNSLYQAGSGFPERLQRSLVEMLGNGDIFRNCNGHLLWVLSNVCREDTDMDMMAWLNSIIELREIISTAFALLSMLHLVIEKNRTCWVSRRRAHDLESIFVESCRKITHPTEKCALMLVLIQHWFMGREYAAYRCYEKNYTEFLIAETESVLTAYFNYIRLQDAKRREVCERYLKGGHFLLLVYQLANIEQERRQNPNIFADMWKHNCFVRTKCDLYESFAVGLMEEFVGNKERARYIFESLVKEHPISEDAINTLKGFYDRHPEMV